MLFCKVLISHAAECSEMFLKTIVICTNVKKGYSRKDTHTQVFITKLNSFKTFNHI